MLLPLPEIYFPSAVSQQYPEPLQLLGYTLGARFYDLLIFYKLIMQHLAHPCEYQLQLQPLICE